MAKQDITVIFDPPANPHVRDDVEIGKPNDIVMWSFTSTDPRIVSARIQFRSPAANFFTNQAGAPQNWYEKALSDGKCLIHGKVPRYGKNHPTSEKYSVSGLDNAGQRVTSLDPSVIVDEP